MVKPHGLRGEVVVELVTDRVERVAPGSILTSAQGTLQVVSSRPHKGRHLVTFTGVDTPEAAERLRDTSLSAPPLDDPDVLWVHHLVGSEVTAVDGSSLGRVVAVEANPASDLLVLEDGGLVPLRFVVGTAPGRVTVEVPPGLLD